MTKDYTKHSLEKIQEWIRDAIDTNANPHEIYDAIVSAMKEDFEYHQMYSEKCEELLNLLKGVKTIPSYFNYKEEIKTDKKWILTVQSDVSTCEFYVNLPDDLVETVNICSSDKLEWVDNKNGTYTLRKLNH